MNEEEERRKRETAEEQRTREAEEQERLKREKELKEEEDRFAKEQSEREGQQRDLAEKERSAQALKEEQARKEEEDFKEDIVWKFSPQKGSSEKRVGAAPDDNKSQSSHFSKIEVKEGALNQMKAKLDQQVLEAPPDADSRKFNENDILGEYDRDEKGNVMVPEGEDLSQSVFKDKGGNPTNQRGYLIDPATGDVINNLNG